MKKLLILSLTMMALLSSISVFAGDVPESLLYEDYAQIFLGKVVNYTTKEVPSAPYTEIDTLECIPTEKIKGDVEIGVKQSYQGCYCSIDLKPDVEYLFGYFNDTNVYVYEIESREDGKFKLVDSDIHDMTNRLEAALNDGSFEKAEKQRIAKTKEASSTSVVGGSDEPKEVKTEAALSINTWGMVGIGAALVILIAGVILIIKKKSK